MAISASRFSFLDQDTNVAIADFTDNEASDILNQSTDGEVDYTDELESITDGEIDDLDDLLDDLEDEETNDIADVARDAKDKASVVGDTSKLSAKQLESISNDLFRDNANAKSAFKLIGNKCRDKILSALGIDKLNKLKFQGLKYNSSSKTSACSLDGLSNLIGKMANDSAYSIVSNTGTTGKLLAGIAQRGYSVGLPDVFSKVITNVSDQVAVNLAAGKLISDLSLSGDTFSAINVAGTAGLGSLAALNSGASSSILSNFTSSSDISESSLADFYDEMDSSLTNINPDWDTYTNSVGDEFLSASDFTSGNEDLKDLVDAKMYSCSSVDCDDIDSLTGAVEGTDDSAYFSTAMIFDSGSTEDSLNDEFSDYMKVATEDSAMEVDDT